jgi:septum formation protein
MSEIILASQSPRRRDLMGRMGLEFTVLPSHFDEQLDESRGAEIVAKELALGKAEDVAQEHPNAYVIGSDTIVGVNGRQMEKPVDVDDARAMLMTLSGQQSTVSTGVAVINKSLNVQLVEVATTQVFFKPDSEEVAKLREAYLASEDWKDKAGGYGIQSGAANLIERIDGDYDTVVGLPTRLLAKMLSELGIEANVVTEESPVA